MKVIYLAAILLVAAIVVALTFTATAKTEIPEEEMDSLEGDLDSIDALMQEFDSLGEMGLEEINESLFNQ